METRVLMKEEIISKHVRQTQCWHSTLHYRRFHSDEELARQLVELGYRGSGEVLKREEFEARKAAAEAARLSQRTQQK
ncbi:hypothetical protein NDU88_000127 [Pleurodeles waltl]|uniref:Cilia- and flagella-associated protein 299 n=1 Tax=Pleurodeles waltl TaxID=8319 RepID=A0AAV7VVK0_PLEWA|nr:hypothetical protein NDU88_000127 [Pleurodeles waltl]